MVVVLVALVAAVTLLILVTAAAFARERRARRAAGDALAALAAARDSAARARLDLLRAQISPHFVRNALTAIACHVRSDPERARDLLADFAEFLGRSFRDQAPCATLAEEFRLARVYLELERARFGDRLQVSMHAAPDALAAEVPALMLQPLVENAVTHGLAESGAAVRLDIAAVAEGGQVVLTVADDGAGADPGEVSAALAGDRGAAGRGQPVGLRNVDERLRVLYGDDHGLGIETGVGSGMKVTIRLPLRSSGNAGPRERSAGSVPRREPAAGRGGGNGESNGENTVVRTR
jgi:two-component system LytT family sensor kinase